MRPSLTVLAACLAVLAPARAYSQELPILPERDARPPPTPPNVRPTGPAVWVHVQASRTMTLDVLSPEATFWRHVCETPCDIEVPLEGLYRVSAHGVVPSRTLELEATPGDSVDLDVTVKTNDDHRTGERLIISSYVAAAVGLGLEVTALSIDSSSNAQPVLLWGGVGAAAAAIAFTISGYILQQPTGLSQSSVTHTPRAGLTPSTRVRDLPFALVSAPAASAGAGSVRLPVWRSAETSTPPVPLLSIPVFSTTF